MTDGRVTLTWVDGHEQDYYGHARIIDSGGGVLQVVTIRAKFASMGSYRHDT